MKIYLADPTHHTKPIPNHYNLTVSLRSVSYHFYEFHLERKSRVCSQWPLHWKLYAHIKSLLLFFYWSFDFTIIYNAIRCCRSTPRAHYKGIRIVNRWKRARVTPVAFNDHIWKIIIEFLATGRNDNKPNRLQLLWHSAFVSFFLFSLRTSFIRLDVRCWHHFA